ncbi:MAG: rRNA maturation RNase YbeY [Lautropia sp.]|nr:rRNA maturation RNase YbeY [Lautropia sp.]
MPTRTKTARSVDGSTTKSRRASRVEARPHLTLQVQHDAEAGELPVTRAQLRRWVQSALQRDARLVLRFVGQAESRMLNHRYRGKDKPTNVLTFDYGNAPVVEADVVICLPVLRQEALEQHKSLRNHLAHLVIHGVLHAHGMDHLDDEQAAEMEALEIALLRRFRIDDPYTLPTDI